MQVANTILQQLGGNRFIAMTGAKNLVGGNNFLQFKIGNGAMNKANTVKVVLDDSDTYTVEFWAVRGANARKVETHPNVYWDSLRLTFTAATGMQTSL